ncbi:DUF1376 domain-containing protein [Caulobacter sp. RL271]|uniref:YdaU family protein n=1 Tax=Caulobacter segnis TaxID=88688 RepID=A0ABY4ZZ30_9CAUL|nr:DUF1376 domain-containing protein [Caulobacter segnis]USQ97257.1 YdaU family protein [Caulobacter segnis]
MKRENFYRRDPSKALAGMVGLSLEERAVYNTIIDLLYSTWLPLEDDRAFIANWCGCAVQKLNPIIKRLIEKERLITFTEGARTYLSDAAFEVERRAVKGPSKTRSGRAQVGEKSGEVGEKSGEVEQKSDGVGENLPLLDHEIEEIQDVGALEKRREEENRSSEAKASSQGAEVGANVVREVVEAIWDVWPKDGRKTSSRHLLALAVAALLADGVTAARLIAAAFAYAADKPAWGVRGRPKSCHGFYDEGRWENFGATADAAGLPGGVADLFGFDGPAQVRAAVVAAGGDDYARSYLDPATWRAADATILTSTKLAAEVLKKIFEKLERAGVRDVIWKGAA